MQHGSQGIPASMPALLLRLLLCLACWDSRTRGDMPMQRFSRAELVRIAGYGEERLSSVLIVGSLVCDACMEPEPGSGLRTSHVAGAKVELACKTEGNNRKVYWTHGTTDEYGDFLVDLPSHLHAIPRLEEACIVMVIGTPENSFYSLISGIKPRSIKLSSTGNSIRVYTTGTLRLSPRTKPSLKFSRIGDAAGNLVKHKPFREHTEGKAPLSI